MASKIDFAATEVCILDVIRKGRWSQIFLVSVDSLICVMKVYHNYQKRLPIFDLERAAYTRLEECGLCDMGIVPKYYGFLEKFDPRRWEKMLDGFLDDEFPPSAIFIEHIPDFKLLDIDTYSEARMANFVESLKLIHAAHILHDDVKPRNMMISNGSTETERIVFVDFDRARTFDSQHLTEREKEWFAMEMGCLEEMGPCLAVDQIKGHIDESLLYFCT